MIRSCLSVQCLLLRRLILSDRVVRWLRLHRLFLWGQLRRLRRLNPSDPRFRLRRSDLLLPLPLSTLSDPRFRLNRSDLLLPLPLLIRSDPRFRLNRLRRLIRSDPRFR